MIIDGNSMIPFCPLPRSEKIDQTNIVSIAAGECHPAGTAVKNTVPTAAETAPMLSARNGDKAQNSAHDVTQWRASQDDRCQHCGEPMTVKRRTGSRRKKYCSTRCRVAAHRARQAEDNGREN